MNRKYLGQVKISRRVQESYKIKRGKEWDAFDEALEIFGAESLLEQFAKAMGTNELSEMLGYIYQMNDIEDSEYVV